MWFPFLVGVVGANWARKLHRLCHSPASLCSNITMPHPVLLFLFQGDQTDYMINVTCWGWLVFDVNAAHDIHARLFIPHQTWRMFRLSHISVQIHNFLYESPCWSEPGIIKPDFEQIRFWLKVSLFVWSLSSVHERWSRLKARGSGCIACGLIVKHIYHLHHAWLWNFTSLT